MSSINPFDRLNLMIVYQTKGLPHRNKLRIPLLNHFIPLPRTVPYVQKSSFELDEQIIRQYLDVYFPDWENPEALPPLTTQHNIRKVAEEFSRQFVLMLGTPEECEVRRQREYAERRAIKEQRRKNYEEAVARKRARREARKQQKQSKRERRVFEP